MTSFSLVASLFFTINQNAPAPPWSINLKPSKPEKYYVTRDFRTVSTWIYQVFQYLSLAQLNNPMSSITDDNKITFASAYLTGNAAVC